MQEYNQLGLSDFESELYNGSEDYCNDREYQDDDDDDDDDLYYVETGRSLAMFNITEPVRQSTLPDDVINFNHCVSDDDEEQDYMAIRKLVLYGRKLVFFLSLWCLV